MLIPDLFSKYKIDATGIIHIGAHSCEERPIYIDAGFTDENIIWIEGNPDLITLFKSSTEYVPSIQLFEGIIADKDDKVDFIVTNNTQSSSILELEEHKNAHPDIHEVERKQLQSYTLPVFCEKHNIDIRNYNFLIMDIQGAELLVLKGMKDKLNYIQHIYAEVNIKELYKGTGLLHEITSYLKQYGFYLIDVKMTCYGWGDAFYSRKQCNIL